VRDAREATLSVSAQSWQAFGERDPQRSPEDDRQIASTLENTA